MEELAGLHGGDWTRRPLSCTKSPNSHTEFPFSSSVPGCHLPDSFPGPITPLDPLTIPHWRGLTSVGKCMPGGRWLPGELIKSGQISEVSSVVELCSQILAISKYTLGSHCRYLNNWRRLFFSFF